MVTQPASPTGRKRALAVVTGRYQHDQQFAELASPVRDADVMRRVLLAPELGAFDDLKVVLDANKPELEREIWNFFADADEHDLLFVYISGHGIRDQQRRLYIAAADTDQARLPPTAVSSQFVAQAFESSPAGTAVLVLDVCHAGAYEGEPALRGKRQRVVILTAGATQKAHEGDRVSDGAAGPSAFARAFFEGIASGRADSDRNGQITVREAYDHAVRQLETAGVDQTPEWRIGVRGDVMLSQSPRQDGMLPRHWDALVRNPLPAARVAVVEEMIRWLGAGDENQVRLAENALSDLRLDQDERVAEMASRALASRFTDLSQTGPVRVLFDPAGDPEWYRSAVFYEVSVPYYADGNSDGSGDLRGLRGRLEYLRWLGVDCLILSPIFEHADSDQDVVNFMTVDPRYGDVSDLRQLLDAAHRLGIRVVLDLVLNHTSDAHPWFQASRREPAGAFGDFYVWNETDLRYRDAIRSADALGTGWTYDPVRREYYWHQFAQREPDLNYDHEPVRQQMLGVLRHWLDLGIDGYRLLSAPYLFEEDGTPCEGLDETHDFLRQIRSEVDNKYPGRILMAWTEKWPADASEYFGTPDGGPEFHVVMHASLMPRIFLSMRSQGHEVLSEFMAQAQSIPDGGAWGLFLRNGDEMSLETVDSTQAEYLLSEYAPQARMRTPGGGIRRRLGPMLDGDRGQLELCLSLLLSLPGAPIIFYGDEIAMGENLRRPGLDAVRTPMQWSTERGAGFSAAEPDQFVASVLLDSLFGYQATNVESQRRNHASILNLVRRLLEVRRHSQALLTHGFRELDSANPFVMAYLRGSGAGRLLVVANFSRDPQATAVTIGEPELTGGEFELVEATGGARFGGLGAEPVRLTMPGYGFYWLRILPRGDVPPLS